MEYTKEEVDDVMNRSEGPMAIAYLPIHVSLMDIASVIRTIGAEDGGMEAISMNKKAEFGEVDDYEDGSIGINLESGPVFVYLEYRNPLGDRCYTVKVPSNAYGVAFIRRLVEIFGGGVKYNTFDRGSVVDYARSQSPAKSEAYEQALFALGPITTDTLEYCEKWAGIKGALEDEEVGPEVH